MRLLAASRKQMRSSAYNAGTSQPRSNAREDQLQSACGSSSRSGYAPNVPPMQVINSERNAWTANHVPRIMALANRCVAALAKGEPASGRVPLFIGSSRFGRFRLLSGCLLRCRGARGASLASLWLVSRRFTIALLQIRHRDRGDEGFFTMFVPLYRQALVSDGRNRTQPEFGMFHLGADLKRKFWRHGVSLWKEYQDSLTPVYSICYLIPRRPDHFLRFHLC